MSDRWSSPQIERNILTDTALKWRSLNCRSSTNHLLRYTTLVLHTDAVYTTITLSTPVVFDVWAMKNHSMHLCSNLFFILLLQLIFYRFRYKWIWNSSKHTHRRVSLGLLLNSSAFLLLLWLLHHRHSGSYSKLCIADEQSSSTQPQDSITETCMRVDFRTFYARSVFVRQLFFYFSYYKFVDVRDADIASCATVVYKSFGTF